MNIDVGHQYDLPAGHAYLQPAMRVIVTEVKPDEWVAYENEQVRGCSRMGYFKRDASGPLAESGT